VFDLGALKQSVDEVDEVTLPKVKAMLEEVIQGLHGVLDRLNGMSVVVVVPEKKGEVTWTRF
jgi:uncharacterized protein YkvS